MTEPCSSYQTRQARLHRQIVRIGRRLTRGETINRQYAWARLAAFLLIGAATWVTAALLGSRAGWIAFFVTVVLFFTIVAFNRRLDRWIECFRTWHEIYTQELARLTLDWEHIPAPVAVIGKEPPPLALDLDLIGFRSLHHLVDTAVSRQGSALLAHWLTGDTPDLQQIVARQAVVRELARLPRFRKRLVLIFRTISQEPLDGEKLLRWLQAPFPTQMLSRVLPVATLLGVSNGVLLVLNLAGLLPPYWVLTGLIYALLYSFSYGSLSHFLAAVSHLDSELGKFQAVLHYLETYPLGDNHHVAHECAPFRTASQRPTRTLSRLKLVTTAAGLRNNPVVGLLLNLLLPWDFWTAALVARYRERMARLLPAWLEAFHRLEALISLGAFSALHPEYTFPIITTEAQLALEAHQLGHPLLPPDRKVCNDFQVAALGELSIITGSNMAGKSTFIRTVGVNLCLAYAGGPVNAAAWHSLPFRIYTCIRISDSLGDGFSYFYAEVKRLKGLLEALKPDGNPGEGAVRLPLLYLIDEIFRGTNNRERMLGSRAYASALIGAAGIGLIATHDLELAHLADVHPQVHNYHFRDEVQGEKLVFDYLIRPGPSPTTNALKIMQMEGLPVPE